jgi:TonB family protein
VKVRIASLEGRSWALSLGVHLFFYGLLWLLSVPRFLDLTNVDWATLTVKAGTVVEVEVEDEVWRTPGSKNRPADRVVKPKPKAPEPTGATGVGEGFRSVAQVNRLPTPLEPIVPAFPEGARRAGVEGSVIIQVDIDEAGLVKQVSVVQGLGYGCDESALDAVRGARFSPALVGDQPVPVRVRIPFRFQFQ